MQYIFIEQTNDSPKVTLDYENGFIEIAGKSYSSNTFDFYDPIITWLKEYFEDKAQNTTIVNMKLQYFNSGTAQILFSILDIIKKAKNKNITVNWYYNADNEDTYEDYEDIVDEYPELNIVACKY